ncbi:MAG: hypothetical protein ACKO34_05265 [Vampirovibrionales bacterium]
MVKPPSKIATELNDEVQKRLVSPSEANVMLGSHADVFDQRAKQLDNKSRNFLRPANTILTVLLAALLASMAGLTSTFTMATAPWFVGSFTLASLLGGAGVIFNRLSVKYAKIATSIKNHIKSS